MVATIDVPSFSVLGGIGDGTFMAATTISALEPTNDVAIADFNDDEIPDVVVTTGTVTYFQGNGDRTFQSGVRTETGVPVFKIQTVDLDEDGAMDVLAFAGESVVLLRGVNTGARSAPSTTRAVHRVPRSLRTSISTAISIGW